MGDKGEICEWLTKAVVGGGQAPSVCEREREREGGWQASCGAHKGYSAIWLPAKRAPASKCKTRGV